MPSELVRSVRSAISSFLKHQTEEEGHIAVDILRAIKDEAHLQMERQIICDTFDASLNFRCNSLKSQIERIKSCMSVISCSRTTTLTGMSTIESIVEFAKAPFMSSTVKECIRMRFNFKRLNIDINHYEDDIKSDKDIDNEKNGGKKQDIPTHITYDIDYSIDYLENKRILSIEVYAPNNHPSVLPAVPFDDDEMQDYDEDGNLIEDSVTTEKAEMSISSMGDGPVDRYNIYVDPENMSDFNQQVGLEMDHSSSIDFLMTWPFYEHEWDIYGFLLDSVFGPEDEEFEDIEE